MSEYLTATGRKEIAELATSFKENLSADEGVEYDKVIEVLSTAAENKKNSYESKIYFQQIQINLDELKPRVNGPFTPDLSHDLSSLAKAVAENNWPDKLHAALIGSCTNSSYEDMTRAASVVQQALDANLKPQVSQFIVTPGSEQIRATLERDGILDVFRKAGAIIASNACGSCIGQWRRSDTKPGERNSIISSFNRNFKVRSRELPYLISNY